MLSDWLLLVQFINKLHSFLASNPIFFSFISIILMNIMCDSGVILKEKLILLFDFEIKHMIPDQMAPQSVQLPLSFTEEM